MLSYLISWAINLVIIATVAAVVDESLDWYDLEDHQATAAFLIFFIPTLLEITSYLYANRPFAFILGP